MLAALEPRILACPASSWEPSDVLGALYGLQSCRADHAEVRRVLEALRPAIDAIPEQLPVFRTALGLYGLQACADAPAVRAIIQSLARCTDLSAAALASLPAQGVSMALMGLAGPGEEAGAVFLDAIVPRAVQLTAGGAAALVSSNDLCAIVIAALALCPHAAPPQAPSAVSHNRTGPSSVPNRHAISSRYSRELAEVYAACAAELSRRTPLHRPEGSVGGAETTLRRYALEAFDGDDTVTVQPSAAFIHGVEADIMLHVSLGTMPGGGPPRPRAGGAPRVTQAAMKPVAIVNIEVDGRASNEDRSRRVAAVRDAHLLRQGVRAVVRWDTSADRRGLPSRDDFTNWLRSGVQALRRG